MRSECEQNVGLVCKQTRCALQAARARPMAVAACGEGKVRTLHALGWPVAYAIRAVFQTATSA